MTYNNFGKLKQFFNITKPQSASSFSTIPLTFSSSLIFFSNESACDFGPSGEPRLISSSFFGVLIPYQSLWKDAENVDRRFSVMSPGKKLTFRGFNFESQRSFRFNNFFEIFQHGSVIIT